MLGLDGVAELSGPVALRAAYDIVVVHGRDLDIVVLERENLHAVEFVEDHPRYPLQALGKFHHLYVTHFAQDATPNLPESPGGASAACGRAFASAKSGLTVPEILL